METPTPIIDPKKMNDLCHRIWSISGALKGIGALLEQQSSNPYYEKDELFGLGQFLKKSSEELSRIEDDIRSSKS